MSRPSRRRGTRSTAGPTSTRSERCSTTASRACLPTAAHRSSRSPSSICALPCRACNPVGRRSPTASRRSSRERSPSAPTTASRTWAHCGPRSRANWSRSRATTARTLPRCRSSPRRSKSPSRARPITGRPSATAGGERTAPSARPRATALADRPARPGARCGHRLGRVSGLEPRRRGERELRRHLGLAVDERTRNEHGHVDCRRRRNRERAHGRQLRPDRRRRRRRRAPRRHGQGARRRPGHALAHRHLSRQRGVRGYQARRRADPDRALRGHGDDLAPAGRAGRLDGPRVHGFRYLPAAEPRRLGPGQRAVHGAHRADGRSAQRRCEQPLSDLDHEAGAHRVGLRGEHLRGPARDRPPSSGSGRAGHGGRARSRRAGRAPRDRSRRRRRRAARRPTWR